MNKLMLCFLAAFSSLQGFEPNIAPEKALATLVDGNDRFSKDKMNNSDHSQERRQALVSKQNPFAIIVGCSDSRVSPDLVFDQGIGDLFVVRNAGNIVGNIELDTIDYGVLHLNAGLIVVVGHQNCGAVHAVLTDNTHDIETIASMIEPSVKNIPKNEPNALEKAVKANVMANVKIIQNSPKLQSLVTQKKLRVVGGYYNLETGKVELLAE